MEIIIWFLSLEFENKQRVKDPKKPVSFDPGIRKYGTSYNPEDGSMMYGYRWMTLIMSLCLGYDKMQSELTKLQGKERQKMHASMICVRKRIHNLKKEMRFKIAKHLVENYDIVIMPKLDTKTMTVKATRKLTTKVSRQLAMTNHCEFFDLVKRKCEELGKIFLHVKEPFTSQTCPCCGKLSKNDEVFVCHSCGFTHDRDIVGALNIFLRSVRREAPEVPRRRRAG